MELYASKGPKLIIISFYDFRYKIQPAKDVENATTDFNPFAERVNEHPTT